MTLYGIIKSLGHTGIHTSLGRARVLLKNTIRKYFSTIYCSIMFSCVISILNLLILYDNKNTISIEPEVFFVIKLLQTSKKVIIDASNSRSNTA